MLGDLSPYPDYKDSGIDWLGKIPSHWTLTSGRSVLREKAIKNTGLRESQVLSLSYGNIVVKPVEKLHGLVPASFETYQIVNPGDIIIRPTDLQNDWNSVRVGHSSHRGIITSAYICIETRSPLTPEYGYAYLNACDMLKVFYGMGSGLRQNLAFSEIKRMPLLVPSEQDQAAIVRFINHADRRIRRAIRAKRKLIALLNEQKQVIINQAVTQGLDSDVRLKPSGLACLGDVPKHWDILPLKRWVSTKITDGPHETPQWLDEGIPFVSAEAMVGGRLDFSRRRGFISQDQHEVYCRKCHPRRGDIFMCKSGATTGKIAIVETDDEFSVWSPLALIRANPARVLSQFLFIVLQSSYIQRQVQDTWSYGTQPNLSMAAMERLLVALPPHQEQIELLKHLFLMTEPLSLAITNAQSEITFLLELRTRLISDAVTGKLDVRAAAAQLSAEEPTTESADDTEAILEDEDIPEDAESEEVEA